MSKTSIPTHVKNLLLVKSGGRCEYRGCNQPLHQDLLTKKNFNKAYIAHIVADEPGGPRGDKVRSKLLAQDIANLMLMCDAHHRLIDKVEVAAHPEALLLRMKKEHEDRIERVTAISSDMQSHILTYRANIGVHTPELSYQTVSQFLLPEFYPAQDQVIDLSHSNSLERDKDPEFWSSERRNLDLQFDRKLLQSFTKDEIKHLSVFAFAPIPLLIKLGVLINDIYNAQVYQPVRNPKTWKLTKDPRSVEYIVSEPPNKHDVVALNISLSGTITNDRIESVLSKDCSIYTLTIKVPFNDFLKSREDLDEFSRMVRLLFNQIKSEHGQDKPLHIFPAMPIATAIELGRAWMPKADMPLKIYDQNSANGGFSHVLEISNT